MGSLMRITRHPIQSRQQWLAMRQEDVTASDVPALFNASPYKSELQLYAEKAGLPTATAMTNIMQRGLWLEPAVIAAVKDLHPDWDVEKLNVYLRAPELRFGATPDAIATVHGTDTMDDTVNLQLKVVAAPQWEKQWGQGVPLDVQLQTLSEAMLLELPRSVVAVLVVDAYGAELHTFDVARHPPAEERILARVQAFHQNLAKGVRPAARTAEDGQLLAKMFPESQSEPVLDLGGDNELPELLERREGYKATAATYAAEIEAIDTQIKDKMAWAGKAELPGWRIAWPTITRREYTVPAGSYRGGLTVTRTKEGSR
jgi:predicted phage-related endonuclease